MTKWVEIRYVGNKPMKPDTVAGSRVVWLGRGDVQEVEESVAQKLLRYPGVWVAASDEWCEEVAQEDDADVSDDGDTDTDEDIGDEAGADDSDSGEEADTVTTGHLGREQGIIAAIKLLDASNPEHYSTQGRPKVDAVKNLFGAEVTAKEVKAAFDILSAG